jgi:5-methylcytosine-specific restriction endonuclease McrA
LIRLAKLPEPEVLIENRESWTDEFAAYKRGEDVPKVAARRYADPEVQEALKRETARKCAYCESRIEHIDYPHVEHILPKAERPDLVCDWSNLTLACTRCNVAKGDYYEPNCELVNPYRDEIGEHLIFAGAHLYHRSNDRGLVTINKVDLNRNELVARRKEAIEAYTRIRDLIGKAPVGPVREVLEAQREELLTGESEYLATTSAFHAASSG